MIQKGTFNIAIQNTLKHSDKRLKLVEASKTLA